MFFIFTAIDTGCVPGSDLQNQNIFPDRIL